MTTNTYSPPVDRLLAIGNSAADAEEWPDYLAYGLDESHVPELGRLAADNGLLWAEEEGPQVWGPIHARRVLGLLRSPSAVEPLAALLRVMSPDDDWGLTELPVIFSLIGVVAVPTLTGILRDPDYGMWSRVVAADSLALIAIGDPSVRDEAVSAIAGQLLETVDETGIFNGGLVNSLLDLEAVEAAPQIERAFAEDKVDPFVCGDWEDVQVALGLLPARLTPRDEDLFAARPGGMGTKAKKKARSRRKIARKSKRKNRRRK